MLSNPYREAWKSFTSAHFAFIRALEVLDEANSVREKCKADIKAAKRKGARAVKELKDAEEKTSAPPVDSQLSTYSVQCCDEREPQRGTIKASSKWGVLRVFGKYSR